MNSGKTGSDIENEANAMAGILLRDVIGGGGVIYKEARHEVKHSIPTYQKSIDKANTSYLNASHPR